MATEETPQRSDVEPLIASSESQDEANNGPTTAQKRFQGWRMGATLCAAAAGTVLTVNVFVTIAASVRNGQHGGLVTIQKGSSSETARLDLWLHLLINVLSTTLLAASNYCMQCLSAPTREDIDKAHSRCQWLDIGVPSIRNLRNISGYRLSLWWLLALSSIPLHLLYNSTVISTQASNEYNVYVASPDLLSRNGLNWSAPVGKFGSIGSADTGTLDQFRNISSWNRLSNDACIQVYSQAYIIGHGDVIAITSETSTLNTTVPMLLARQITGFSTSEGTYTSDWICSALDSSICNIEGARAAASSWALNDTVWGATQSRASGLYHDVIYSVQYPVEYCLSQPVQERCIVQLSLVIMAVVILCNAVKLSCMILLLWQQTSAPLVTIGDAIESFMLDRDTTTQDMCWANKKTFISQKWEPSAKPWLRQRHLWFASASIRRWLICNICSIATIITASILFHQGIERFGVIASLDLHISGFGTFSSDMSAGWNFRETSGILLLALIINIPQLLLSFLFLNYNGLYTCMLLVDEWSGYAHERKPLRVTNPSGSQRSTYRLQLPYKYGIPLLIISTILHWLVSNSLFLARVNLYTRTGEEDTGNSISTVGYSYIPLLIVIILGSITVLVGLLNGCRRYKPGIPFAGSCSAAISAACHAPDEDVHASEKPLLWGVVGTNKDGIGHCSFTSLTATAPTEGESYAGI